MKSFWKLREGECRYIVGEPRDLIYCGEPVSHPKRCFCDKHHKLCYIRAVDMLRARPYGGKV